MSTPSIAIIVAMAKNRTIGVNNTLPWRCPDDLKRFKAMTMGHHIIMGRKTFESIGRVLPGRTTVVVTHNPHLKLPGCIMANSLPDAVAHGFRDTQTFIVGGAEIYQQAMSFADTLYITEIQQNVEGDARFPYFDVRDWRETAREQNHQELPEVFDYHYVTYKRK